MQETEVIQLPRGGGRHMKGLVAVLRPLHVAALVGDLKGLFFTARLGCWNASMDDARK